jgi:hypothetical protein
MRENLSEKSYNEIQGTQLDRKAMKLVAEVTWCEQKALLGKIEA